MWCLQSKKTQILIEFLDRTQKSFLVVKKSFLGFRGFCTHFLLLTTPYVMNILIGAQDFCWPKFINQLVQKSAFGRFLSCVGIKIEVSKKPGTSLSSRMVVHTRRRTCDGYLPKFFTANLGYIYYLGYIWVQGQLVLKRPFLVFKSTKKPMKSS